MVSIFVFFFSPPRSKTYGLIRFHIAYGEFVFDLPSLLSFSLVSINEQLPNSFCSHSFNTNELYIYPCTFCIFSNTCLYTLFLPYGFLLFLIFRSYIYMPFIITLGIYSLRQYAPAPRLTHLRRAC